MRKFLYADGDIFQLNSEMLPVVAHLEDAQIPLGILSNTSNAHWNVVIRRRFGAIFSAIVQKVSTQLEPRP